MEALVFYGESWFVVRQALTEFAHEEVGIALTELGFVVEREERPVERGVTDRCSSRVSRTRLERRTTKAVPLVAGRKTGE